MRQFIFIIFVLIVGYQSAIIKELKAAQIPTSECPTLSVQRMKIFSHGTVESVSGKTTCLYNIDESLIIRNARIKKHYGTK